MDEKGLGVRLQQARKTAGMTQQVLCHQANLSYSTLAKIERGAIKAPSIFTIQSIAQALDISLDDLMGTRVSSSLQAPAKSVSKHGVRFVYFDINGCLVHFFHQAFGRLAEDAGVSQDSVESIFWYYNDAVCRGTMSMDDFNQALAARVGLPSVDWESYYLDAVAATPGMADLVRWTAERYRVGLLTNIMPGFVRSLREHGLLPDVAYDVIVDSSEVGTIKPEARIFQIAQERAGVSPHEILFIDDDRANIMAADQHGWHVMWCDDFHPEETIARVMATLEPADV